MDDQQAQDQEPRRASTVLSTELSLSRKQLRRNRPRSVPLLDASAREEA